MKYNIITFCFFFLITSCKTSKNVLAYDLESCEDGIKEAINDAQRGKYNLITYGLVYNIKGDGFGEFYDKFMRKNYKVNFSLGGCVVTDYSFCYKKKIEELLLQKYDDDFFEKSKLEAITAFKKTKEFTDEIKPKIDSGKVYSQHLLHDGARFLINQNEAEFLKHLGFANFKKDYFNRKNYCRISFIIEKDGNVSSVEFKNSETHEPLQNEVLLDKIQSSPKWKPGVYLGELVRTRVYLDVPIRLFETYPR